MRRSQIENYFDFFVDSPELGSEVFLILCQWKFYPEELQGLYVKHFSLLISQFLSGKTSSKDIRSKLNLYIEILDMESIRDVFSTISEDDISKIRSIWQFEPIPKKISDASSFPFLCAREVSNSSHLEHLTDENIYKCICSSQEAEIGYGLHNFREKIDSLGNSFDFSANSDAMCEVIFRLFHNDRYAK